MLFDIPNTIIRPHKKLCQKNQQRIYFRMNSRIEYLGTENKPKNRLKPTNKNSNPKIMIMVFYAKVVVQVKRRQSFRAQTFISKFF